MRTQQLETRKAVIKGGGFPGIRVMTGAALLTKSALMKVILLMTGKTIGGCARENIILMAFLTQHAGVRPTQFEGGLVMVESGRLPPGCLVTGITVLTECSVMAIVFLVTGKTLRRRTFEDLINMTFFTDQVGMRTSQLKIRQVMIKFGWLPTIWHVTGSTVSAKLSRVNIILEMADPTFRTLGFKISRHQLVKMTFLACQTLVLA